MDSCPHCGSELDRPTRVRPVRRDEQTAGVREAAELVSCPDCDGVIDGFRAH